MIEIETARILLDIGAVGFTFNNPIRFKSGILSPVYVDNRRLPYYPEAWRSIIQNIATLIDQHDIKYDLIGGIAVGGVPHSSALAFHLHKPSIFVRSSAKEHGKAQQIEGGDVNGKQVLMIEDLVTTGGSSISGIQALRDAQAIVDTLIAIVSYGFDETKITLDEHHLQLYTLTSFDVIIQVALESQYISQYQYATVQSWLDAPYTWTGD